MDKRSSPIPVGARVQVLDSSFRQARGQIFLVQKILKSVQGNPLYYLQTLNNEMVPGSFFGDVLRWLPPDLEENFPRAEHVARYEVGRLSIFRNNCQGWTLWDSLETFRCPVTDQVSFSSPQEAFQAWRQVYPLKPLEPSKDRLMSGRME